MKYLMLIIVPLVIIGCTDSSKVTKEDCFKKGQVLKKEKKLNFRSGKYQYVQICVNL